MNIPTERKRFSRMLTETNAELSLRQYGTEACAPGHYFSAARDHWLLHLVLDGKGTFHIGGQTYELGKDGAFLIPPHTDNWYRADSVRPWTYYWIGFSGAQAPMLMRAAGFRDGRYAMPLNNTAALISIVSEIPVYDPDDYAQRFIAQGYLYMFLGLLVRENGGNHFRYSPTVADALDCIHTHYGEPLSVTDIAARVNVSRATLYRAFVRECGLSPGEYLVGYRLKASIAEFDTDKSLAEIAYGCGFGSYAHYADIFRTKYGISPSAYRNRQADGRQINHT